MIDDLKQLLEVAETEHEKAEYPGERAYWQGRKDALRTVLSLALNDDSYSQQIGTSVYAWERSVRDFVPVPADEITKDSQCVECGSTYFHKPGCLHGAGLSREEFLKRYTE